MRHVLRVPWCVAYFFTALAPACIYRHASYLMHRYYVKVTIILLGVSFLSSMIDGAYGKSSADKVAHDSSLSRWTYDGAII